MLKSANRSNHNRDNYTPPARLSINQQLLSPKPIQKPIKPLQSLFSPSSFRQTTPTHANPSIGSSRTIQQYDKRSLRDMFQNSLKSLSTSHHSGSSISDLQQKRGSHSLLRSRPSIPTTSLAMDHMKGLDTVNKRDISKTTRVSKSRMGTAKRIDLSHKHHHNEHSSNQSTKSHDMSSSGGSHTPKTLNVVVTSDQKSIIIDEERVKYLRQQRRKRRRKQLLNALGGGLSILFLLFTSLMAYVYHNVMSDPSTLAAEEVIVEDEYVTVDANGNEVVIDQKLGEKLYHLQEQLDFLINEHGSLEAAEKALSSSSTVDNADGDADGNITPTTAGKGTGLSFDTFSSSTSVPASAPFGSQSLVQSVIENESIGVNSIDADDHTVTFIPLNSSDGSYGTTTDGGTAAGGTTSIGGGQNTIAGGGSGGGATFAAPGEGSFLPSGDGGEGSSLADYDIEQGDAVDSELHFSSGGDDSGRSGGSSGSSHHSNHSSRDNLRHARAHHIDSGTSNGYPSSSSISSSPLSPSSTDNTSQSPSTSSSSSQYNDAHLPPTTPSQDLIKQAHQQYYGDLASAHSNSHINPHSTIITAIDSSLTNVFLLTSDADDSTTPQPRIDEPDEEHGDVERVTYDYRFLVVPTDESVPQIVGRIMKRQVERRKARTQTEAPPIIGAPPNQFNHPYESSSYIYRVFHFTRRALFITWTFLPFLRHYFVTHIWRDPKPSDRADMLEILLGCLENSGCAFIKFGQWLSMRPDIFPLDVIETLSRLRDGAPSHSFEETVNTIKQEFQGDMEDIFESFSDTPIASGSIAQVYKARLTPEAAKQMQIRDGNGELVYDVAVKIRHPSVLSETWLDLDLIYSIVDRVPGLCIPFHKDELKLMIQYQIDFRFEGHYLSRFRYNFFEEIKQGYIQFPYVSEQSLRESVLIESWAGGQTVSQIFSEVGDMFRPIFRANDIGPVDLSEQTYSEYIKKKYHDAKALASDMFNETCYYLADRYGVRVDGYNSITNENNEELDNTFLARALRKYLPPRGRVGEEKYVWDNNLSQEENERARQKKVLAYTLFDMFIKMFLRDNLIHADLHAGNVLYEEKTTTATVLDAGMTVALESDIMKQFGRFLLAICSGDADGLVETCSRFEVNLPNSETIPLLDPIVDDPEILTLPPPNGSGRGLLATCQEVRNNFQVDIHQIFNRFYRKGIVGEGEIAENVSIGDVVGQVLLTMQKHGVILRGDVAASIMAMSVIEGLLRQLDPELDIVVKAIPYFIRFKGYNSMNSVLPGMD